VNANARRIAFVAAAGLLFGCATSPARIQGCSDDDVKDYARGLEASILRAWSPPADAASGRYVVTVGFRVDPDGRPYDAVVSDDVDEPIAASVREAFTKASDLPTLEGNARTCLSARGITAVFTLVTVPQSP
jgi:hypothetical protein